MSFERQIDVPWSVSLACWVTLERLTGHWSEDCRVVLCHRGGPPYWIAVTQLHLKWRTSLSSATGPAMSESTAGDITRFTSSPEFCKFSAGARLDTGDLLETDTPADVVVAKESCVLVTLFRRPF